MKIIVILVIFCQLAYCNKSNFLSLFIALYIYFVEIKIDAIIFLNHLGLSILYKILLKKSSDITSISKLYIKKQSNNTQLVGI